MGPECLTGSSSSRQSPGDRCLCSLNLCMGQNSDLIALDTVKPVLQKFSLVNRAGNQKGGRNHLKVNCNTQP